MAYEVRLLSFPDLYPLTPTRLCGTGYFDAGALRHLGDPAGRDEMQYRFAFADFDGHLTDEAEGQVSEFVGLYYRRVAMPQRGLTVYGYDAERHDFVPADRLLLARASASPCLVADHTGRPIGQTLARQEGAVHAGLRNADSVPGAWSQLEWFQLGADLRQRVVAGADGHALVPAGTIGDLIVSHRLARRVSAAA